MVITNVQLVISMVINSKIATYIKARGFDCKESMTLYAIYDGCGYIIVS